MLQDLETLPLAYIREGLIIRDELVVALAAYRDQREPKPIDPYVTRWDEVAYWERESAAKPIVGLRLDEIVYMVRTTIQNYKPHAARLKAQMIAERNLSPAARASTQDIFITGIAAKLKTFGIDSGGIDQAAFGRWLWRDPTRTVGHRIHFEAYHQLLKDRSNPVQDGDIADFALIAAVPYVDRLTVDKRIGDVLHKVFRKVGKMNTAADLSERVFTKISKLLET
jgi:hypothetical protein